MVIISTLKIKKKWRLYDVTQDIRLIELLNKYNSSNIEEGFVSFDIDAQGFLGGQYRELVYTKDGTFYYETDSYLYEETNGNNIVRAERINEHWWYLWNDYDGTEGSY